MLICHFIVDLIHYHLNALDQCICFYDNCARCGKCQWIHWTSDYKMSLKSIKWPTINTTVVNANERLKENTHWSMINRSSSSHCFLLKLQFNAVKNVPAIWERDWVRQLSEVIIWYVEKNQSVCICCQWVYFVPVGFGINLYLRENSVSIFFCFFKNWFFFQFFSPRISGQNSELNGYFLSCLEELTEVIACTASSFISCRIEPWMHVILTFCWHFSISSRRNPFFLQSHQVWIFAVAHMRSKYVCCSSVSCGSYRKIHRFFSLFIWGSVNFSTFPRILFILNALATNFYSSNHKKHLILVSDRKQCLFRRITRQHARNSI